MVRLAKVLVLAVWIVGAVIGGLTVQPALPPSADESLTLLVNTDYMDLGVTRTQAVLVVTTPWQSEWEADAPLPGGCDRSRSRDSSVTAKSKPPAPQPDFVILTRFPLALP